MAVFVLSNKAVLTILLIQLRVAWIQWSIPFSCEQISCGGNVKNRGKLCLQKTIKSVFSLLW